MRVPGEGRNGERSGPWSCLKMGSSERGRGLGGENGKRRKPCGNDESSMAGRRMPNRGYIRRPMDRMGRPEPKFTLMTSHSLDQGPTAHRTTARHPRAKSRPRCHVSFLLFYYFIFKNMKTYYDFFFFFLGKM